jgi:hypothetical protein
MGPHIYLGQTAAERLVLFSLVGLGVVLAAVVWVVWKLVRRGIL